MLSSDNKKESYIKKNINFFIDNFFCWKDMMSEHYPLSENLLKKYKDKWNWRALSRNELLPWSENLLKKYKDKWNWGALSGNKSLPWSGEFIDKFKDKWNWTELSSSHFLPWSNNFIDKFKDKWDWTKLSSNKSLPWSGEFIEKYIDKWELLNLSELLLHEKQLFLDSEEFFQNIEDYRLWTIANEIEHISWSEKLIEKYENKWDWIKLSSNKSLPWSRQFIEKYIDKWDWTNLSGNPSLPRFEDFIEKYKDKWNWDELSKNQFPWSEDFNEKHKKKINDNLLQEFFYYQENLIPWSEELIERVAEGESISAWHCLSSNRFLPWSRQFIEKYIDKWDWDRLSSNESIPWTEDLIHHYYDKWSWGESGTDLFFCKDKECKFHNEYYDKTNYPTYCYVEEYEDGELVNPREEIEFGKENEYDYDYIEIYGLFGLSANKSLPWSEKLIEKYENKWDWNLLINNLVVWKKILKPVFTESIIDYIMEQEKDKRPIKSNLGIIW